MLWASATVTSSRAGRLIGSASTVAWMMAIGMLVAVPIALVSGPVPVITPTLIFWMAASGLGGVAGIVFAYRGLSLGKVGVVAALASTEGAIAAVMSVIAGEPMTVLVAAMLCVIAGGVAVVALLSGAPEPEAVQAVDAEDAQMFVPARLVRFTAEEQAVLFGAAAAVCFGISIYGTAKLGASMSPIAAVVPVRVIGFAVVFIPLLLSGRLRITRRAVPMVLLIGSAEVFGNAAYAFGAQDSIAIAAVLASQFAALSAIGAFLFFKERLSRYQKFGVVVILVGVAFLTLARG
ncbi:MAG TPA: DMT family transporter [Candidatus Limnocylindrales bacterium]